MNNEHILKEWRIATEILAEAFRETYYPNEVHWHWAGGEVGDIFFIGDYSFNDVDRMRQALEFKATREQVEDYFDMEMSFEGKQKINFENYVKFYKKKEINK